MPLRYSSDQCVKSGANEWGRQVAAPFPWILELHADRDFGSLRGVPGGSHGSPRILSEPSAPLYLMGRPGTCPIYRSFVKPHPTKLRSALPAIGFLRH